MDGQFAVASESSACEAPPGRLPPFGEPFGLACGADVLVSDRRVATRDQLGNMHAGARRVARHLDQSLPFGTMQAGVAAMQDMDSEVGRLVTEHLFEERCSERFAQRRVESDEHPLGVGAAEGASETGTPFDPGVLGERRRSPDLGPPT